MRYVNAKTILPDSLVEEIQKYIQGKYVYIPSQSGKQKMWGENSGSRNYFRNRNEIIRSKYIDGNTIDDLAEEYFLSINSIKKIIYTKNK